MHSVPLSILASVILEAFRINPHELTFDFRSFNEKSFSSCILILTELVSLLHLVPFTNVHICLNVIVSVIVVRYEVLTSFKNE